MLFKHPKFIKSAVAINDCPKLLDAKGQLLPEIAVLGRTNVGKSTLLNHLFQAKRLVKASSTPGKTQMLNFFTLNDQLLFVDIPGYGWSKAHMEESAKQKFMIENYLCKRASLKLLLFLLDIRRTPSSQDLQMFEWIEFHKLPTILVLTKIDKVTQSERGKQTQKILSGQKGFHYVHYSATKNKG